MRSTLALLALLLPACQRAGQDAPPTAPTAELSPWQTIDETFKGCEGG